MSGNDTKVATDKGTSFKIVSLMSLMKSGEEKHPTKSNLEQNQNIQRACALADETLLL